MNKKKDEVKLHLGCYHRKIYGYTNIDIREDVGADLVDDAFKLEKFKEQSVDVIYVSHVLEHATRYAAFKAMKRWYKVLKFGGILRVCVPDLEALFEYYISTKDLDSIKCLLYGSQKHEFDFHYTGWDEKTLTQDLKEIGFLEASRYDWQDTEHYYVDDYSQCYLPEISYKSRNPGNKIEGKLVSLNVQATK